MPHTGLPLAWVSYERAMRSFQRTIQSFFASAYFIGSTVGEIPGGQMETAKVTDSVGRVMTGRGR